MRYLHAQPDGRFIEDLDFDIGPSGSIGDNTSAIECGLVFARDQISRSEPEISQPAAIDRDLDPMRYRPCRPSNLPLHMDGLIAVDPIAVGWKGNADVMGGPGPSPRSSIREARPR